MRGFTLIEILMVVAIIGILASVIMPKLSSARDKALDAAIMVNLNGIRGKVGILFTEAGESYAAVCSDSEIARAITESGKFNTPICADDVTAWAAEAQLKNSEWYCVDSSGNASEYASSTVAEGSDYQCG